MREASPHQKEGSERQFAGALRGWHPAGVQGAVESGGDMTVTVMCSSYMSKFEVRSPVPRPHACRPVISPM